MIPWIQKADHLLRIDPRDGVFNRIIEEQEIIRWFRLCNAYWVHDGNLQNPHAELISGKCSNGFIDCLRVLEYPRICEILARQFYLMFRVQVYEQIRRRSVDWVIGSSYAAMTFSHEVAKFFGAKCGFCEKDPDRPKKFLWRRRELEEGTRVLQVEELVTTSLTFQNVREAVEEGNPNKVDFLPIVGSLVHRPPELPVDYNGRRVAAVIEKEIWAVDQKDCPLCKAGSERVRPKTHWKELTG